MTPPRSCSSPPAHSCPPVYWFYGRSGAGKTTLLWEVAARLEQTGRKVFCLDGDELRRGLCRDLGFTEADRNENHRRAAEVAALAAQQGLTVLVATMAPRVNYREAVAQVLGQRLRWFYVNAALETCTRRDPKGQYQRPAGAGHPQDVPFEPPVAEHLDLTLNTEENSIAECVAQVLEQIAREESAADRVEVSP
ncbi:adenylyl-sulfate kinase [Verrucomicrobium sp. BvORR106]|uniref:adenylyl-sulfate kinase n=1 Tax=Verrucomicrobium sp. BvORR106 TaxID=1403819 RepID=UPI00068D347D|nr:adenylyl-sulfate kinase [Verrucomicrobium sp. BvORR106]